MACDGRRRNVGPTFICLDQSYFQVGWGKKKEKGVPRVRGREKIKSSRRDSSTICRLYEITKISSSNFLSIVIRKSYDTMTDLTEWFTWSGLKKPGAEKRNLSTPPVRWQAFLYCDVHMKYWLKQPSRSLLEQELHFFAFSAYFPHLFLASDDYLVVCQLEKAGGKISDRHVEHDRAIDSIDPSCAGQGRL